MGNNLAMNPCPCGYFGDRSRECTCTPVQVQRYQSRLSGPLLDRIDLHVEVPPVKVSDLAAMAPGSTSEQMRGRVHAARTIQEQRFAGDCGTHCNAQMATRHLREHCRLKSAASEILQRSIDRLGLSARAYNRILKIARTVADLAGAPDIETPHLTEAIQYRRSPSANL